LEAHLRLILNEVVAVEAVVDLIDEEVVDTVDGVE